MQQKHKLQISKMLDQYRNFMLFLQSAAHIVVVTYTVHKSMPKNIQEYIRL